MSRLSDSVTTELPGSALELISELICDTPTLGGWAAVCRAAKAGSRIPLEIAWGVVEQERRARQELLNCALPLLHQA